MRVLVVPSGTGKNAIIDLIIEFYRDYRPEGDRLYETEKYVSRIHFKVMGMGLYYIKLRLFMIMHKSTIYSTNND